MTTERNIVVGAGLVGLFVAHELARRGRKVVVLERDRIASGTTGASFAWLNATSKIEPDYHRLNAEGMRRHMALAAAWGEHIAGQYGSGAIWWAEPGAGGGIDALAAHYGELVALDYPCLWLERKTLAALEPHVHFAEGAAGLFAPGDRWLEADRLARHVAREIDRLGGEVRENAAVMGVERNGDGRVIAVDTEADRFTTDTLVLAAGPSTADTVAMVRGEAVPSFPVDRVPGLLVTLPPDRMRDMVRHVLYAPDSGEFHIRPTAEGGLMLGSDDVDAMVADDPDAETLAAATRALLERARHYVPDLPADTHGHDIVRRIGVRPMPRDGRTIAGPLPGVPECYVIATHSGITLAPLLGELIAEEIVSGEVADILSPFRPDRFAG